VSAPFDLDAAVGQQRCEGAHGGQNRRCHDSEHAHREREDSDDPVALADSDLPDIALTDDLTHAVDDVFSRDLDVFPDLSRHGVSLSVPVND
jgi:hypothetical protein